MIPTLIFATPGEPTKAQIRSGNYSKRRIPWNGLILAIENEPGSIRRGFKPDGTPWATRMLYPYGYVCQSEGVDGDEVDIFLGPNPDAPVVYVIHQRKVGAWSEYDEDKCMLGFDCEADAVAAFLANYDDPRFLGPITAMSVEAFVAKARATKDAPAMIKALLLLKSDTGDLFDKVVQVKASVHKDGTFQPAHVSHRRAKHATHPDLAGEEFRERVARNGVASLADHELLNLYLARSTPLARADEVSRTLLKAFGSLGAVLGQPEYALANTVLPSGGKVGDDAARDLKTVQEMNLRVARETAFKRVSISSWTALNAYVKLAMQHETREQFRVLFLDKKNQLLADEVQNYGTTDHAPVYPREVMRRALELGASNVILVHNHPSGDPTPSHADIDMTKQLVEAGRTLRVGIHDHLVVGREGVASFRSLGLM